MTDHEHNRFEEDARIHFRKGDNNMPEMLKWAANFIQRVGFPIFMCCILSYLMFEVLNKNTQAVNDLRVAIVTLTERIQPYK